MPIFEVTGKDGGKYQIEAGDENAALSAFRKMQGGSQPQTAMGTAKDVGASFGSGLVRGAGELAMLPVTLPRLMKQGIDWGMSQLPGAAKGPMQPNAIDGAIFGAQDQARGVMDQNLYAPQTTAGEYAKTVGEFIPGAVAAPGSILGNAFRFGVVPGVASETAGQLTKGTAAEPWARAGAGIAAGVGMAVAQRPSSAQQAIEGMAGGSIPRAELQAADALMAEAASRGVKLTPIEALNQVTNNKYPRLAVAQRTVETSPGGAPAMGEMMAQRPGQVQAAGQQAFDQLAPNPAGPQQTGIAVRNAADATIKDTQRAINDATRPAYQAAENVRIAPQDFARLQADPMFGQILSEIRSRPELNKTVAHLPDDSVGVIDLVQRIFRERSQNAAAPGQASTSNTIAANFESSRAPLVQAAEAATGGPTGPYATAKQAQEQLRGKYLEPLTEGRVGQMAGTTDVGVQTNALFPPKPQAGSAPEVAAVVSQIAKKDPKAAIDLVGQHARTVFAEATQNNASGPNQFGGGNFAAQIRGNAEQAASLEAAVRALPGGNTRWDGFSKFLDVLEATGKRLPRGSDTNVNQQMTGALETGGIVAKTATTGGVGFFKEIGKYWDRYQLSGKTEAIANLLTNSSAMGLFGRLAKENGVTPAAQALSVKLLIMAGNAAKAPEQAKPSPIPNVRQ